MDFPIAGVTISPLVLIAIGFVVGIMGGFFGVGGGFIAGPMMFWFGVPMNFVVGTDLAYMTGKSIVAAKKHGRLGNVDIKLGFIMVTGTVIGVEIGARIIEMLKVSGNIDMIIGVAYVIILLLIGSFTAWESLKALHIARTDEMHIADEVFAFTRITTAVRKIKLWPMIKFPVSGIEEISLWVVLTVGIIAGLLAGALGVGGGFIRMPMLIYLIGVPTHVAIGTDLFEIMFSAGFGTFTHALKGNVDVYMALVMQTGAIMGAKIGATMTQYFTGPKIRLAFAVLPFIGAALVIIRLVTGGAGH